MARPEKIIDWNEVEKRMESKSTARELAAFLRIDINTFYDRFKKEYGKCFADCVDDLHSAGKSNLRFVQYQKALEGNTQMMVLLGKFWLDQKEIDKDEYVSDIHALAELFSRPDQEVSKTQQHSQSSLEANQSVLDKGQERQEDSILSKLGSEDTSERPSPT